MYTTGSKSYLSKQINLVTLMSYDLFTDEEYAIYEQIISLVNEIEKEKSLLASDDKRDPTIQLALKEKKQAYQNQLNQIIASHAGTPRCVRLKNVLDISRLPRDGGYPIYPPGVSWRTLKTSRKIAEFASDESRAMGLDDKQITFDKIIIKWKSLDVLRQIVLDGFYMDILHDDGSVERRRYQFITASAGQLRTDKIQCMSVDMWNRIQSKMMCGLSFDDINAAGGINVNKLMAYIALASSATDPWPEMDIDRCIVIDDFEAPASGLTQYIDSKYQFDIGMHEAMIKHTDGCGMVLPSVMDKNAMCRGPFIKGLLAVFDFIKFCQVHHVEPVLTDIYGKQHDLIAENIQVIFTKSQFKLWAYYKDWDDYKNKFKENGCCLSRTNYEEDEVNDTTICYQMLQQLEDFTDEEIDRFTRKTHDRIEHIAKDKNAMLRTLKADRLSQDPYKRALAIYPELLREAYSKNTLKDIKKKWTLDAKSGRIRCENKRLFVIPDLFAACEHWFLGIEKPEGILKNKEVACKPYRNRGEIACLRSPSLYMEWVIENVVQDQSVYDWFTTDGIYTSCHDLISKVLQFDNDGDMLNCVADKTLIDAAKRNIERYNVIPLLYDLGKAAPQQLNREEFFNGLKRAHDFSGIGAVSNSLTKLWNREHPDREAAAMLCFYNNLVIDAAKTGFVNSYEQYPEIKKKITKAIGGRVSRMPYFFQFSKNGRKQEHLRAKDKKQFAKPNQSTMNRICARFDDIGMINMNYAGIAPFNWQMLLAHNQIPYNIDAVKLFCEMDDANIANIIRAQEETDDYERTSTYAFDLVRDLITEELVKRFGNLEAVYPSIVKYLFAGTGATRAAHKQMFWRVFGEMAYRNLENNVKTCSSCSHCRMKIPTWVINHTCEKNISGFFECVDCGIWCERTNSKQCRCVLCQAEYRKTYVSQLNKKRYERIKVPLAIASVPPS